MLDLLAVINYNYSVGKEGGEYATKAKRTAYCRKS